MEEKMFGEEVDLLYLEDPRVIAPSIENVAPGTLGMETSAEADLTSLSFPASPIQERHIDFILEEEFACNPAFLQSFLSMARKQVKSVDGGEDKSTILYAYKDDSCEVARSVQTHEGETDILVVYSSPDSQERIALLIEDKIGAIFQKDQAPRYRKRGEAGKLAGHWEKYWTCLVCPSKYTNNNAGFDTRVTLEEIETFFRDAKDERSLFRSKIIGRALQTFATTGPKIKDLALTEFRSFYAQQAASFFSDDEIVWDRPRDAWHEDTWFKFRGGILPKGVLICHKAERGIVDMQFSDMSVDVLKKVLSNEGVDLKFSTAQTGKSASIRLHVNEITHFSDSQDARVILGEAFACIRQLLGVYKVNGVAIHTSLVQQH